MGDLPQYRFKHHPVGGECRLVCPNCLELLLRIDIEHFTTCPYCGTALAVDRALEDFLLQPAIDSWLAYQSANPSLVLAMTDHPPGI